MTQASTTTTTQIASAKLQSAFLPTKLSCHVYTFCKTSTCLVTHSNIHGSSQGYKTAYTSGDLQPDGHEPQAAILLSQMGLSTDNHQSCNCKLCNQIEHHLPSHTFITFSDHLLIYANPDIIQILTRFSMTWTLLSICSYLADLFVGLHRFLSTSSIHIVLFGTILD